MKETKEQRQTRLKALIKLDKATKHIMEASEMVTSEPISEKLRDIAFEIRVLNDSANRIWK